MCEFCDKYGDGERWYLKPENYARRMYKVRKEAAEASGAEANPQDVGMGGPFMREIIESKDTDPEKYQQYKSQSEAVSQAVHCGQIVTLEETEQILDIAYPIARMTCACRRATRGLADDDNFTCIGIGPGMYKWERWPETYRGGVEFLDPEEAKAYIRELDRMGMVHTVDTFGTPYIGGLCQCDYPSCLFIRMRVDYGVKILMKGHYVAVVDYDRCTGCVAKCVPRCQFGAMKAENSYQKVSIDPFACFGCGLCETSCPKDAIRLRERTDFPALVNEW